MNMIIAQFIISIIHCTVSVNGSFFLPVKFIETLWHYYYHHRQCLTKYIITATKTTHLSKLKLDRSSLLTSAAVELFWFCSQSNTTAKQLKKVNRAIIND